MSYIVMQGMGLDAGGPAGHACLQVVGEQLCRLEEANGQIVWSAPVPSLRAQLTALQQAGVYGGDVNAPVSDPGVIEAFSFIKNKYGLTKSLATALRVVDAIAREWFAQHAAVATCRQQGGVWNRAASSCTAPDPGSVLFDPGVAPAQPVVSSGFRAGGAVKPGSLMGALQQQKDACSAAGGKWNAMSRSCTAPPAGGQLPADTGFGPADMVDPRLAPAGPGLVARATDWWGSLGTGSRVGLAAGLAALVGFVVMRRRRRRATPNRRAPRRYWRPDYEPYGPTARARAEHALEVAQEAAAAAELRFTRAAKRARKTGADRDYSAQERLFDLWQAAEARLTKARTAVDWARGRRVMRRNASAPDELDLRRRRRQQGSWVPAGGGERPFRTRSGRILQYVWQPSTGRHAYYDVYGDRILPDAEAARYIGLSVAALRAQQLVPNAKRGYTRSKVRGRIVIFRGRHLGHKIIRKKYRQLGYRRASQFAWPAGLMYPIDDAKHVRLAASRFAKWKRRYPANMRKTIASRIDAAKRRFGIGEYNIRRAH